MNNDLIKQGAYYLLRGGTLLSEPCKKCGNLQIKYKEDVICMNCQHIEQGRMEPQETSVSNIETKKEIPNVRSGEDDKGTLNTLDDIHEVLSQVEHKVLQSLAMLNVEQDLTASPKRFRKYLKIVQTSLKTIEMIKHIKKL
ncbi:MAG TPA: Sjogren's syndrome/scleroderma autoantigen 1 family protein [Nitrososphaeraceae archaeon]|jgi:UPF0148 protein|uniref:Sjogren's syndrome/scleroderma autoantigen 1 (Autoantigen p27) n=1 Tax=Candidatus Nitrosocosmicus oleophilus TaxID=1353260 RepID=A0A654MD96_9ARCH|nr:Sjogren's syndrome/scleroderma autoantigen 1 family protein [Candidatus Nitrosocosmicus oleophilus]ALI37452.1 Sjogren's syndrome/scleroderma autoantigen 1 (Autoantigen p27) [Candidatus Nitrosocosmicus oleophilus]HVP81444.1 Sjogren's syndrome/scleroderma autoantigen 1 family protein [Nitrososphaeraceae archaeon]